MRSIILMALISSPVFAGSGWAGAAVASANRSDEIGLTKEQAREISKKFRAMKNGDGYREWLRAYLGPRSYRLDQIALQSWLADNRSDLGLRWVGIKPTPEQAKDLKEISIPVDLKKEIKRLQGESFKNVFRRAFSDSDSMFGEPYTGNCDRVNHFLMGTMAPDLVLPQLISCIDVQLELGLSTEQVKSVTILLKGWSDKGWDEEYMSPLEMQEMEKSTRSQIKALLTDEQWSRVRQIACQQHAIMIRVDRIEKLFGVKARRDIGSELYVAMTNAKNIERILTYRYVAAEVEKVIGKRLNLGKPSVLRRAWSGRPDMKCPVLSKLMRQGAGLVRNVRRER